MIMFFFTVRDSAGRMRDGHRTGHNNKKEEGGREREAAQSKKGHRGMRESMMSHLGVTMILARSTLGVCGPE